MPSSQQSEISRSCGDAYSPYRSLGRSASTPRTSCLCAVERRLIQTRRFRSRMAQPSRTTMVLEALMIVTVAAVTWPFVCLAQSRFVPWREMMPR